MSLVKWSIIGLLVLPAAELMTFLLVAVLIGWLWTVALFVATSVVGMLLLRQSGRADIDRLRHAFAQDGLRGLHLETPGMGPVLGGILLVFPGFITDILGAALYLPALRRWVAGKLATRPPRARRRGRDGGIIDLEPGEWRRLPDQRRRRRKPKDAGERRT
jgi:UPF0716 protein FxsA